MLSNTEIVLQLLAAIEGGYIKSAGAMLSDDFAYIGTAPEPIGKDGFLELHQALVSAMPDWSYNPSAVTAEGDKVRMNFHVTGRQINPLDITSMGVHRKPSHLTVTLPEEPAEFTLCNGKISSLRVGQVAGGGVQGIFLQLGIETPVVVGP